jgi:hypothetical protein
MNVLYPNIALNLGRPTQVVLWATVNFFSIFWAIFYQKLKKNGQNIDNLNWPMDRKLDTPTLNQ